VSNGALLKAAEAAGFGLLLSTDQDIRYQQGLRERKITIVVLSGCTKWSRVRPHFGRIAAEVNVSMPGSSADVYIPFDLSPTSPPQRV
jgi:hypothetical protein